MKRRRHMKETFVVKARGYLSKTRTGINVQQHGPLDSSTERWTAARNAGQQQATGLPQQQQQQRVQAHVTAVESTTWR